VRAGFSKIHLDASMSCADDHDLPPAEVARRAAGLCAAAEAARAPGQPAPVYVVGTEVPPPGGAKDEEALQVTRPADALETLRLFEAAFRARGLEAAWERVVALVVQPGVEFGDSSVHAYAHEKAAPLSRAIEGLPGLVYEAHSTDYQTRAALRGLVEDHFAILKVGPQLTYAYREALFALAQIEKEWLGGKAGVQLSGLVEAALATMRADAKDWAAYYRGSPVEIEFAMKYSLSDRVRYYWLREPLRGAVERLMENLSAEPIPLTGLSQFLPEEYRRVREGEIENNPEALVRAHVRQVLEDYAAACQQAKAG
jgi:D-tagatose-1,6-bisphosphate aldolase subunit GatZ/KbaZ